MDHVKRRLERLERDAREEAARWTSANRDRLAVQLNARASALADAICAIDSVLGPSTSELAEALLERFDGYEADALLDAFEKIGLICVDGGQINHHYDDGLRCNGKCDCKAWGRAYAVAR